MNRQQRVTKSNGKTRSATAHFERETVESISRRAKYIASVRIKSREYAKHRLSPLPLAVYGQQFYDGQRPVTKPVKRLIHRLTTDLQACVSITSIRIIYQCPLEFSTASLSPIKTQGIDSRRRDFGDKYPDRRDLRQFTSGRQFARRAIRFLRIYSCRRYRRLLRHWLAPDLIEISVRSALNPPQITLINYHIAVS